MTSYHGVNLVSQPVKLNKLDFLKVCCLDYNDTSDKVQIEYSFEIEEDGIKKEVYLYSWKEYRPLTENSYIQFNIGANNSADSYEAKRQIENALRKLN